MNLSELSVMELFGIPRPPLDVLVLSSKKRIADCLKRDLHQIKVEISSFRHSTTLEGDYAALHSTHTAPNLVILSLDFGTRFTFARFFHTFPPQKRPFGLIVLHEPTRKHDAERHLASLLLKQDLAGYLELGRFGNKALKAAVESAWLKIHQYTVANRQKGIIQGFINAMRHPLFTTTAKNAVHTTTAGNAGQTSESIDKSIDFSGEKTPLRFKRQDDVVETVSWDRIVRLEMHKNYSDVWYFDNDDSYRQEAVRTDEIQTTIPPIMQQVHRSHRVHLAYLRELTANDVMLVTNDTIPVGKAYRKALESQLQQSPPPLLILTVLQDSLPQSINTQSANTQDAEPPKSMKESRSKKLVGGAI